jgi:tyrosyl-tRNA synthetase
MGLVCGMTGTTFLDELAWRGLLFQHTEGAAAALSKGPVTGYCGFDPTASSLHAGNLVAIMSLVHLQRAGHRPVAMVGGGTGMIGDPSGKASERVLLTRELVDQNLAGISEQLSRVLDFDGPRGALMRNNGEWLRPLDLIGFLRDVGKHFTVNYMLQKDSVDSRMGSESGISFTEFAYMLLQAYDFAELYRRDGVTLQVGGSDQWGNITAGTTLVRKMHGAEAHGVTLPLLTTSAGTKFGKSESGAIWLDAGRTSPYQFYQFWIGADDRDVGRYLRTFTLLSRAEIEALDAATAAAPEKREAQQLLAKLVTTMIHGAEAAQAATEVSTLLFAKGDPTALTAAALAALAREVPTTSTERAEQFDTLALFVSAGLTASKGEARRLLQQGGLSVNGAKLTADDTNLGSDRLLRGQYYLLRKGARDYALIDLGPA